MTLAIEALLGSAKIRTVFLRHEIMPPDSQIRLEIKEYIESLRFTAKNKCHSINQDDESLNNKSITLINDIESYLNKAEEHIFNEQSYAPSSEISFFPMPNKIKNKT